MKYIFSKEFFVNRSCIIIPIIIGGALLTLFSPSALESEKRLLLGIAVVLAVLEYIHIVRKFLRFQDNAFFELSKNSFKVKTPDNQAVIPFKDIVTAKIDSQIIPIIKKTLVIETRANESYRFLLKEYAIEETEAENICKMILKR